MLFLACACVSISNAQEPANKKDNKGLKQGAWEKRDASGNIIYRGSFINDKPDGEFVYYDSLGNVKARTYYSENGSKAQTTVYNGKKKISDGMYLNEKRHGVWKFYNSDSIVAAEEVYDKGVPSGLWKTYYPNGALYEEMPYVNGKKEGVWAQYFYDGPIKVKATYKNDMIEGLATFYHPNGRVFISGPYVNNLKNGVWTHFNDKGIVEKKEIWQEGRLVSEEYYDKAKERMVKEEK